MSKKSTIIITVVVGVALLLIGNVFWPLPEGGEMPTGLQLPLLIILDLVQSFLFGFGLALLLTGWPVFRNLPALTLPVKKWTFASAFWLLGSWWPHVQFHIRGGEDLWNIIFIDYFFHLTVIAASLILIRSPYTIARGLV